ncbi:MAG: ATP-binding protein [Halioglobus sp.]
MPMSGEPIYRSVIFQVFLAMAVIAGMALSSMSLSVYVTMNAQNDAEAINLAGSLRMQSYKISNVLAQAVTVGAESLPVVLGEEVLEFDDKLRASIIPELISQAGNVPLQRSYDKVLENWESNVLPVLIATRDGDLSLEDGYKAYNFLLSDYVSDIDDMVSHLQRENEGKIELLGMTEGVSIFLIMFIVLYLIMKADSNFVIPLRRLLRAAQDVERGNLGHRVDEYPDNELGALAMTFNNMTASLEAQYRTLEDQVSERTNELHRSNQALYFLYKTSREVASSPYNQRLLKGFLAELKKVADVEAINLCVSAQPNYRGYDYLSTEDNQEQDCDGNCKQCTLSPEHLESNHAPGISLPIVSRTDNFGFLYIRPRHNEKLAPWQNQLLNTVAETLSTAFAFHRTLGQEHRVILLEERSTIARELHDSLAQSLSYMKMETARLKKLMEKNSETATLEDAIGDLQEGINAAYKHLRELLVTFRVKLDAPDLHTALEHAVKEFDQQSSTTVRLSYGMEGSSLGPNGDIHVLHIVREALNNAIKHAKASEVLLRCERTEEGDFLFIVEDDGIGISAEPEKEHHYGLYTMRERAERLQGKLHYTSRDSGGTRVQLLVPGTANLLRS